MKQELIITRKADLAKLQGVFRKYHSIRLEVPHFVKEENDRWAALIEKEYKACGCSTGSYFIMAAVVFSLVFFLFNISAVVNDISYYLVRLLILVLGMGLTGKLTGLIMADKKLRLLINILKRKL